MKTIFAVACVIATIVAGFFSFLGLLIALGAKTEIGILFGGVGALALLGLLLFTRDIWTKRDAFHRCVRFFWGFGFALSGYLIFLAAWGYVVNGAPLLNVTVGPWKAASVSWSEIVSADAGQKISLGLITLILWAAPIAVSYMRNIRAWVLTPESE